MKKIFMFFMMFFGLIQIGYSIEPTYTTSLKLDKNGYAIRGQCKLLDSTECTELCENNDDCVYIDDEKCYVADNDGSETFCDWQLVCILGDTENRGTNWSATNACWFAMASNSNALTNGDYFYQSNEIPECNSIGAKYKYQKDKQLVFFTNNGNNVLTDKDGHIAKSIVSNTHQITRWTGGTKDTESVNSAYTEIITKNNICFGYACVDADGKYTEPCDDGTCSENCQQTQNIGNTLGGTTTALSSDNESSENSASTNNNTDNTIHRNTVQPYLDALAAKCPNAKK